MAAPYVPNTAYIYWQCACNGKPVGFGYHAKFFTGAYDQAAIDELADIADAWFSVEMLPYLSVSADYQLTKVRGLNAAIDLEATNNDGAGPGTDASAPLTNNVSFVIKHTTGFTGKSARGRSYMVGIPNDVNTPNEDLVTVTYANGCADAFDELDANIDAAGWTPVVVSRYSAGVLRATPTTLTITDHTYTDLQLDTRRKRLG